MDVHAQVPDVGEANLAKGAEDAAARPWVYRGHLAGHRGVEDSLHVMVAEFLGIFLGKGCYCYGIIGNRKSKDQTWVPTHSNIGNNSSRAGFSKS